MSPDRKEKLITWLVVLLVLAGLAVWAEQTIDQPPALTHSI